MEPEADHQDTADLKYLAKACERHLQRAFHEEESQEDIYKVKTGHWASRQFAEFNLWCAKVDVHGEGLRSINFRLKDVPEIYELLKRLLESLERDLNELQQPADTCVQTSKVDNDSDDAQSDTSSLSFTWQSSPEHSEVGVATDTVASARTRENPMLQRHIEDTIDRLHGHALRIEHAGSKHRQERVEIYRQKEGPKWAYEGFKEIALRKAGAQFPSASESFRQRMAESFARRRIRFEYLEKHQKKRAINSGVKVQVSPYEPQVQPHAGDDPATLVGKHKALKKTDGAVRGRLEGQRTIYSTTENTKLDMRHQPKQHERPESVASVALLEPGFPPPPESHGGTFQCPYCRLEFRAREAETDRWIRHVIQDFEPYFCTVEDCKEPFNVSNTFDGLLSHLQRHVPVRYHIDLPHGEHKEFDETEFEEHIKGHGEVSEEIAAILREASQWKGAYLFESCPFCGGYPDIIERRFPDSETPEAQKELRSHIKQHMQSIAFFLPPYREDVFDEDEDLKSSAVTRRRSIDEYESLVPDEYRTVCDRQDCDCKYKGKYATEDALADATTGEAEFRSLEQGLNAEKEDTDPWHELFGNSPLYDRSSVSNDYYLEDERLQTFVARWKIENPGSLKVEDYTVGIVSGLRIVGLAVCALFDQRHPDLYVSSTDSNSYSLGCIGRHNVVFTLPPPGGYGTYSTETAVANLSRSFPSVRFCLLVGIGGGAPSHRNDIRLGDVVVGMPIGANPGVIQYDTGMGLKSNAFTQTGHVTGPPRQVLAAIHRLKSDSLIRQSPLQEYLGYLATIRPDYGYPGAENDRLFSSQYEHSLECDTSGDCSDDHIVQRPSRPNHHSQIHYGLIASGNVVIKDAKLRDKLSNERDILCFEMETAGLPDGCLVIRGICDYSDSHKHDGFQPYAAAAAASYAKLLLSYIK